MWYKNKVELPEEVIYEIVTKEDDQGFGLAVADVIRSKPHRHLITAESYVLLSGRLLVYIGNCPFSLERPGALIKIPLGATHWAETLNHGCPARISIVTIQAWTPEDHILA